MHRGSILSLHGLRPSKADRAREHIRILEEGDMCSNIRTVANQDIVKIGQDFDTAKDDRRDADVVQLRKW